MRKIERNILNLKRKNYKTPTTSVIYQSEMLKNFFPRVVDKPSMFILTTPLYYGTGCFRKKNRERYNCPYFKMKQWSTYIYTYRKVT